MAKEKAEVRNKVKIVKFYDVLATIDPQTPNKRDVIWKKIYEENVIIDKFVDPKSNEIIFICEA